MITAKANCVKVSDSQLMSQNHGYAMGKDVSKELESERMKNVFTKIESAVLSDKVCPFCFKKKIISNCFWHCVQFAVWCSVFGFNRVIHHRIVDAQSPNPNMEGKIWGCFEWGKFLIFVAHFRKRPLYIVIFNLGQVHEWSKYATESSIDEVVRTGSKFSTIKWNVSGQVSFSSSQKSIDIHQNRIFHTNFRRKAEIDEMDGIVKSLREKNRKTAIELEEVTGKLAQDQNAISEKVKNCFRSPNLI